ncbi:dienelactone hydrolase family protein [Acuticoccus sp. MNP-M23]|uniref:dienelactone hydrolase family protein n=1 Tax=Acuticoccus sp. MNP-M23 TaxID=3072793 RepID=UPI002815BE2C|nr:dienelactone hydrolase family protein [Acuticoccus sp. MNP-M23]WMS43695.1 dienelactone hydrolase family protein [Acuticoccus sp. MNP-M23]
MDDVKYAKVHIPTANPFVLNDFKLGETPALLKAELYLPATAKPPFPAVVVNEGLGGVKHARERRYGRFLAQNGCAALVVDSFGTRGYGKAPHPIRAINVTESMMLADAFGSLTWLAAREDVDSQRISNIGFSYGGMICILTAYEQMRRHFVAGDEKFASHVSYYGPTVPRLVDYTTTGAPIAILNGKLDQNFSPERLELIVEDLQNGGSAVENMVFDNVYHQWDSDDHERRFDRFNIQNLKTRIDPDNQIISERSGNVIRGFTSRLALIARAVSLSGFHLKRDAEIMAKTDALLLRYLKIRADETTPVGATPSKDHPEASEHLPPAGPTEASAAV